MFETPQLLTWEHMDKMAPLKHGKKLSLKIPLCGYCMSFQAKLLSNNTKNLIH